MIDRKKLFETIRPLFKGKFTDKQVSGIDTILNEYEANYSHIGIKALAYCLATSFHETGANMQPVREFGNGRGRKYGMSVNGHVYYGRGHVQLTWDYNYKKAGDILGVDLLHNPDLALDPVIAVKILFRGMIDGWFTGRKLSQYFTDTVTEWQGARRIINGTDRAVMIAGYAQTFYNGLK